MVRFEFRFNDSITEYRGIRVQFMKDYAHASDVEELANFPHQKRREWARILLAYAPEDSCCRGNTTLTPSDFSHGYGQRVGIAFPNGATVSIIYPNSKDHDIMLVIQVLLSVFYFILYFNT